ncbi:GH14124 [Drosophila grimshawi]|uniref:GH14124 n=1 Tax=Drosophila grimshawi TaxID=7222 RepID=B4JXY9_DROGR|nr:GH14124 [Drosophila grimshawi]
MSSSTTAEPAAAAAAAESLRFGITDYTVFTIMLCASAAIGIYFGFFAKAKNTTEEYLRGGKKMKTLPIAISLVASQLSGLSIMSVPAETYTFGFNYIFVVISMIAVVPILIYIIVPVFYENNVSNCYEYLEMRFNKFTRKVVTATFVMNSCLMLPVFMFIPSLAFSQVTGWNIHVINALVSSICVFYTMLGGIKAVVWTDVIQGGTMLISVLMVGVLGTMQTGGLSSVMENASAGGRFNFDLRWDPRIRITVWNAFFGGLFMWTGHIGLNQSCVQRIVSLPSFAHAKRSLIISGFGFIMIMGIMSFTGIIMYARYFGCDPMLAGYLQMRFNKRTRQLVTLTFVLNQFLMLPVYMFIPALAFSQVTGVNIHIINTIVSSICVFYTMLGGIKTVVWTDVVQAGVMLLSVVMVGVLGTLRSGGLSTVLEYGTQGGRLDFNFGLDPRLRTTVWSNISSGLLLWVGKIGLDQSCVQRIVSLPSYAHAKKSLIVAGFGILIITFFNSFAGIIMFARYFGCDPMLAGLVSKPDKMMPFFIQDIMGSLVGMPGLFISCVFSASLSSLSANLNSLAGVVYFDYIKPHIRHTEARANGCMKLVIIGMGGYCILGGFVVQRFNSILQTVWTITGINTGAVVGIFLLGMFVPRVNGKVAMTSILFSVLVMLWIIINAQLNFKEGLVKYEVLPNSLDQCEARGLDTIFNAINGTTSTTMMTTPANQAPANVTTAFGSNREFSIYDISFYWYKVMGAILIFVWAVPMSYVWRMEKGEQQQQNPKLYSPFVRSMLHPAVEKEMEELPLKGQEIQNGVA